jgi:hypothetical protein
MRPTKGEFLRRAPRPASAFSRRLKSASQGAPRQASASADAKNPLPVGTGRPSAEGPWRPNSFGAQADRRPKAFVPIEIGPSRRSAPGVGLRRRKEPPPGRHRPTVGRRLLCRLKSAPQGAPRQASASADAKNPLPVGTGRPSAEGPWRPNSFGAQADRRPKASVPIEIGPSRRSAPGVGLRRRKEPPPGRHRPTVGRRLLCRLKSAPQGAPRQASASADAKNPLGRRRPTVGRRPLEAEFIRRAGRPSAEGFCAD